VTVVRNNSNRMMILDTFWKPEVIVATLAVFVSIVSVVFTALALKYQRRHNYKSVRPIGVLVGGNYENNIFIKLENNGIGPLIIKKMVVSYKSINGSDIINVIPTTLSGRIRWSDYATELEDKTIPASKSINLLVWTPKNYEQQDIERIDLDRRELRDVLKLIKITVYYTDVYEQTEYSVSESFDGYGE
jgi:hypothetical protein